MRHDNHDVADLAAEIAARLVALDFEGLSDLYRQDAILDASVPQWRYQLQGRDAIRAQHAQEFGSVRGARVAASRVTPTLDGVVVEIEGCFEEDGEECLWREVHILHTDGAAITEHVGYCTGIWDAATIARQAVDAPMLRR